MPATIQKGSTGYAVTECQTLLTRQGYPTTIDGIFGTGTEATVKAFQVNESLTSDGIVGPATWDALQADERGPIAFQAVVDLLPQLIPQRYTLHGAQYPSNPPGIKLKNIGDETTNCTVTAWLLGWAFDAQFTSAQWKLWMVSSTDTSQVPIVPNWGPRVAIEWGAATTAPGDGPCLIQYFTETGGHSLIVVAYDADSDKILTLESNSAYGLDGCGWGEIGNLRDVFNPGPDWAKKVTQTWTSRFGSKVALHVARLRITGVQEWLEQG